MLLAVNLIFLCHYILNRKFFFQHFEFSVSLTKQILTFCYSFNDWHSLISFDYRSELVSFLFQYNNNNNNNNINNDDDDDDDNSNIYLTIRL